MAKICKLYCMLESKKCYKRSNKKDRERKIKNADVSLFYVKLSHIFIMCIKRLCNYISYNAL